MKKQKNDVQLTVKKQFVKMLNNCKPHKYAI